MVAMLSKVRDEFIICKASCLWEPIHSFPDFHVDEAVGISYVEEVVLVNDGLWDDS